MRLGRRLAAVLVIAAGVWVVLPATPASAAPITTACAGTTVGTTFTLTADCDTTVPLDRARRVHCRRRRSHDHRP